MKSTKKRRPSYDASCLRFQINGIDDYQMPRWREGVNMAIVMTLEEVAQFLHVHPSTIYRMLKKRNIPAFKVGSDWRFNQESIERWMREREDGMSAVQS